MSDLAPAVLIPIGLQWLYPYNEIMSWLACRVQIVERGRKIDEEKRNEGRILPSFFSSFFCA